MRDLDNTWTQALAAQGITTGYVLSLEFLNETIRAWTGVGGLQIVASGDPLLDGNTFDPLTAGVPLAFSDNVMSYSGSEAFSITLAFPNSAHPELVASTITAAEYQSRPATIWRAMMITPPGAVTPASWAFRRIRSGAMDKVIKTNTGEMTSLELVIESHASFASAASNSTYLDQKNKFDPADTSQDYAVQIANGTKLTAKKLTGLARAGQIIANQGSFNF